LKSLPNKVVDRVSAPKNAVLAIVPTILDPDKFTTVGADQSVGWNSLQEVWWLIVHFALADQFPVERF
jgi:hypothetical protein